MDELRSGLWTALDGETVMPDLAAVVRRGRRLRLLRSVAFATVTVALVGLVAVGAKVLPDRVPDLPAVGGTPSPEDTMSPEGSAPQQLSERDQAEIFAFRAVAAVGLMEPFGERVYSWTYHDDTTAVSDGWRIGFASVDCAPRSGAVTCEGRSGEDQQTGNALTDTYVTVRLATGQWSVVDVEGEMLSGERQRLIGYSLEQTIEPPHWEFPAVGVGSTGGATLVQMIALWVGPYPAEGAPITQCVTTYFDPEAQIVGDRPTFEVEPPTREFEQRGGWVRSTGVPRGLEVESAEVSCAPATSSPTEEQSDRGWVETGDGPFVTGGYRFSDIEVRLAAQLDPSSSRNRAVIRFDLEWATDTYPGTRTCTWDVFDDQGHKIGSATSPFSALARRYDEPLIKDRVDVTGEPRHVEISCSDTRLDNPDGHFEISEITVEQTAQSASQYRVWFRYRWEGGGLPVPQRCEVIAYGDDGSVVHRSTQRFDAMGTGPNRSFFYAEVAPGEEPTQATVECAAAHEDG